VRGWAEAGREQGDYYGEGTCIIMKRGQVLRMRTARILPILRLAPGPGLVVPLCFACFLFTDRHQCHRGQPINPYIYMIIYIYIFNICL